MAKVFIYKTDEKSALYKERTRDTRSRIISEILDKEGLYPERCLIFLNNRRTIDYNYLLKKEDILFVFKENNNQRGGRVCQHHFPQRSG